jgi:Na+-transporting NADH:ubiquinone oxidoreductase subunit C
VRNKNSYIIIYTVALCIIAASVLAVVKQSLSEKQDKNIAYDNKKKILNTVIDISVLSRNEVDSIYAERVNSFVIDFSGKKQEGVKIEGIDVVKQKSLPVKERMLPVYTIASEKDKNITEFYIFPTSGSGLWDRISSYIAMESDGKTIKGASFDHVGETPGLGARIKSDPDVSQRYKNKKMYGENFEPVAVNMVKGEGGNYDDKPHTVDGMSGATLTANGLNDMLTDYSLAYQNFFKNLK